MRLSREPDPTNLARAADVLDSAVAVVLAAHEGRSTAYEADVEANLMILLTTRDAAGVALLAREGPWMYPAAMVLTRAAYESALRTLWMLHPEDPYERESRYLALLKETEQLARFATREYEEMGAKDATVHGHASLAESLREFREAVTAQLPAGVVPPKRVPRLEDMIAESGFRARYLLFKFQCQYAHTTNYATGIYRRGGLGDAMKLGDFTEPNIWAEPLHLTWWSLTAPTKRLLDVMGADSKAFAASLPTTEMKRLVETLGNDDPHDDPP
jgi:hypothetical protein